MAIVSKPWNGDASRFTLEQYRRSCLITGETKEACHLPVREPNGDLNKNALGAAAAALAGARGGVQASPAQKAAAARTLRRLYAQAGMTPPDSLKRMG